MQRDIARDSDGSWLLCCHRVVEAPWKEPYAEMGSFFNYGLTPARWRAYAREVHQACAQLRLQDAIFVYNPEGFTGSDPEMPPELRAAMAAKVPPNPSRPPAAPCSP